jgi:glutaredoxin
MIHIDIYSKPGCHLCDEAKAVLQKVKKDIPFKLREINIELSAEHHQTYQEEIPVIFIDGKKAFKYRVDEKALRKRLARL